MFARNLIPKTKLGGRSLLGPTSVLPKLRSFRTFQKEFLDERSRRRFDAEYQRFRSSQDKFKGFENSGRRVSSAALTNNWSLEKIIRSQGCDEYAMSFATLLDTIKALLVSKRYVANCLLLNM